jgi:hypothetical protein
VPISSTSHCFPSNAAQLNQNIHLLMLLTFTQDETNDEEPLTGPNEQQCTITYLGLIFALYHYCIIQNKITFCKLILQFRKLLLFLQLHS